MKGKKPCPSCSNPCGCRTLVCPKCDYKFFGAKHYLNSPKKDPKTVKQKKKKEEEKLSRLLKLRHTKQQKTISWRDLQRGDVIEVQKGSGSYVELSDGTRSSIGYRGKFVVHGIGQNGLHVYSNRGHSFIWMGPDEYCEATNVHRTKHKIRLIKRRKND